MVEEPLFTITPPEFVPGLGYSMPAMVADVESKFAGLAADQQAEYLACHEHRNPGDAETGSRAMFIFRSNAYTLTDGTIGIFPKIAKINHSCQPNAVNVWSEPSRKRIIWAGRDITAGEEITVTYVPLLQATDARRQRLQQYGFFCDCEACGAKRTDGVRGEMATTLNRLEDYVSSGHISWAALKKAEQLVRMIEEEELMEYMAEGCRLVAYFALGLGDAAKARRWALRELETHRFADGVSQYALSAEAFLSNIPQ
jgi:SET domain